MLLRPGHVWGTAVFAILASVILVVVVIVLCATGAKHDQYIPPPPVTFSSLGSAFGVILFGFGGHAILPALQAAMHNPTPARFRQSIGWSFGLCTAMYLGTAVSSVLTLGGAVSGDVLTNFSGNVNDFGLIAVTTHLLFAAVTVHSAGSDRGSLCWRGLRLLGAPGRTARRNYGACRGCNLDCRR